MYAVIETGGKQYTVREGDFVYVEKLPIEPESGYSFNNVLAISKDGSLEIGDPMVSGATVDAKVISHGKGAKIIVFKFRAKKTYRRKQGHRQPYTKLQIEKINA